MQGIIQGEQSDPMTDRARLDRWLAGMLRRLAAFGLIGLTLFGSLLLACQGQRETSLTFYLAVLPSEKEAYQPLLRDFSKQTGIAVNLVAQQYAEIRRALQAEVIAGRGLADVIEVDVYYLAAMQSLVTDLTPLMNAETLTGINAEALEAGRFDGSLYYLPHRLSWQAMVYNSHYIENPPATWEELLDVARRYPGRMGLKAAQYEGLTCDILSFVWQAGGDPLRMNDAGCLAAMNFLAAYGEALNPSARSYKENSVLEAQEKEEIYLHFNWPFVVPLLQEKQMLPEPNVVAPLPAGPEGKAAVLGGGYLAISTVAPHPQEAARLVRFLASAQAQRFFVKHLGWMPTRSEAWDALPQEMRTVYHGFIEMAPHVKPRPPVEYYESLSRLWQQAFRDIVFDHKPVKETMDHYAAQAATLRGNSPAENVR